MSGLYFTCLFSMDVLSRPNFDNGLLSYNDVELKIIYK